MKVWVVEYWYTDRERGQGIVGIASTRQGAVDLLRREYPTVADMDTAYDDPPGTTYIDSEDDECWYSITEWEVE